MKKLLIATVGLAMLAGTTAASAQPYGHGPGPRHAERQYQKDVRRAEKEYRKDVRQAHRRWAKGQRLDARYRGDGYYVRDYHRHGLRTPPRGYRWQRVDNDYVLAAVATGLIAAVIAAN